MSMQPLLKVKEKIGGKIWDKSIKVYIQEADILCQLGLTERSEADTQPFIRLLGDNQIELISENLKSYKTFEFNGKVYENSEPSHEVVSTVVENIREIVTIKKNNIWYISYGEKTTGKSTLMGVLPTFSENEDNICFYTLVTLFNQIEADRSQNRSSALKITAFEIFVDQLVDLTNDSYQESKYNWSSILAFTISDAVNMLKEIFSKRNQYIEQFEQGAELLHSQSHLVIELCIQSEFGSGVVSIVDLAGFDSNLIQKIMQGSIDSIPDDCSDLDFISHNNDFSLLSLRNMLWDLKSDNYAAFETHLAQYVYEKLIDFSTEIALIGRINSSKSSLNETLNTLEFCSKFMHWRWDHENNNQINSPQNQIIDNPINPKLKTMPIIKSEYSDKSDVQSETITYNQGDDRSKQLHGKHKHSLRIGNWKQVQISYLDNNWSAYNVPQQLSNFYDPQQKNAQFVNQVEGNNRIVEIPHLKLGDNKDMFLFDNSEVIEDSDNVSNVDSSNHQYSLISGESKRSLKETIQCSVAMLLNKYWSKNELENIITCKNKDSNGNISKEEDIEHFTETLIQNINEKLSQRGSRKSASRKNSQMSIKMYQKDVSGITNKKLNFTSGEFKTCQTYDNEKMRKYVLDKKIKNLSPISNKWYDNNTAVSSKDKGAINKEILNDYFNKAGQSTGPNSLPTKLQFKNPNDWREINIIESDDTPNEIMANSIAEDIKAITSKANDHDSEEFEIDLQDNDNLEEVKQTNILRFSLHEFEAAKYDTQSKEVQNNTTEDVVELETIKPELLFNWASNEKLSKSSKGQIKKSKDHKDLSKGLKLIAKSLKNTEKTMKNLFDLFVGESSELDKGSRNSSISKASTKRSNSVFGCFGSICSVNKDSVKNKTESVKLKKCKSIDATNKPKSEEGKSKHKKHKNEENGKSTEKRKKSKDKTKKKHKDRKDILEIPRNPEAVPVIKGRINNETFDMTTKNKDLKTINLNSTFQKPEIVRKSRNSLQTISKLV